MKEFGEKIGSHLFLTDYDFAQIRAMIRKDRNYRARSTKDLLMENMIRKLYRIDLKFDKIILCVGKYTFLKIMNEKREFGKFNEIIAEFCEIFGKLIPEKTSVYWVAMLPFTSQFKRLNTLLWGANNCIKRHCMNNGHIFVDLKKLYDKWGKRMFDENDLSKKGMALIKQKIFYELNKSNKVILSNICP